MFVQTSVSHSVHRGWGYVCLHAPTYPPEVTDKPPKVTYTPPPPEVAYTPSGFLHPQKSPAPLRSHPYPKMATEAGGMYPNRMHTCLLSFYSDFMK